MFLVRFCKLLIELCPIRFENSIQLQTFVYKKCRTDRGRHRETITAHAEFQREGPLRSPTYKASKRFPSRAVRIISQRSR